MRFRLRTLLILLAILPPIIWITWPSIRRQYQEWQVRDAFQRAGLPPNVRIRVRLR